jgi:protein-tyrosine-phosphatase
MGYDERKLRSKSWDEYGLPDSPKMDFIITVCDNAAGEACPYWPGQPVTAHWGFPDPSRIEGTYQEKKAAFVSVMLGLRKRLDLLGALPLDTLDTLSLSKIHGDA